MTESPELKVIEALLAKGLSVKVTRTGWRRWLYGKEEEITIHQPTLGTLLLISEQMLQVKVSDDTPMERTFDAAWTASIEGTEYIVMALAYAITGGRGLMPERKARQMAKRLRDTLTPAKLKDLCFVVVTMCNTGDFMTSIRLTKGIRMTEPKESNLSREHHGG